MDRSSCLGVAAVALCLAQPGTGNAAPRRAAQRAFLPDMVFIDSGCSVSGTTIGKGVPQVMKGTENILLCTRTKDRLFVSCALRAASKGSGPPDRTIEFAIFEEGGPRFWMQGKDSMTTVVADWQKGAYMLGQIFVDHEHGVMMLKQCSGLLTTGEALMEQVNRRDDVEPPSPE